MTSKENDHTRREPYKKTGIIHHRKLILQEDDITKRQPYEKDMKKALMEDDISLLS